MHSSEPEPPDFTIALRGLSAGGAGAEEAVLRQLVAELRGIAAGYARTQREGHTLQATALVNEAFVRLIGSDALARIEDRHHFFRVAARAMRQILVDHARRRRAAKRGGEGGVQVTLNEELLGGVQSDERILDVDRTLEELAELDPRQARLVELRFFAGLEMTEVAEALGVSLSTAEREWRAARAWFGKRMARGDGA